MILQRIRLQNIRSYIDETINFRAGITLFMGDIGSGKSSILNAIEFALFGLGNQNGAHLLRLGESQGQVDLELTTAGKRYIFTRTLRRRGGKVSQGNCTIIEDDVQTTYSATDMKKRVLQILNFREPPNPRSQSVIYRYAVFTPQEQMREVIRQKTDERKETLRKAFGVEEYSVAADNAAKILTELRSEKRVLQASQEELKNIEFRIEEEKNLQKSEKNKIQDAKREIEKLDEEIISVNSQIEIKKKQKEELEGYQIRHKLASQEKGQRENTDAELREELKSLTVSLEKAKTAEQTHKELLPRYKQLTSLRRELPLLEKWQQESKDLEHKIELLKAEITSEKTSLEERLVKEREILAQQKKELEMAEAEDKTRKRYEGKYVELTQKKKGFPELEQAYASYKDAQQQIALLEKDYTSEKGKIETRINIEEASLQETVRTVANLEEELGELQGLKDEAAEIGEKTLNKKALEETDQKTREEHTTIRTGVRGLQTRVGEKKAEWSDIQRIGIGAECPRCHQELSEGHYKRLEEEYRAELEGLEGRISSESEKLREAKRRIDENEVEIKKIEALEKQLAGIQGRINQLSTKQETLTVQEKRKKSIEEALKGLRRELDEEIFATEIKEKIRKNHEKIVKNENRVEEYQRIKTDIDQLEKEQVEAIYTSAKIKAESIPAIQEKIQETEKLQKNLEKQLENEAYAKIPREKICEYQQRIQALQPEVERYLESRKAIEELEKEKIETTYTQARTEAERMPEINDGLVETNKKIEKNLVEINKLSRELESLGIKISELEIIPGELEKLNDDEKILGNKKEAQLQIIKNSKENSQKAQDRIEGYQRDRERHAKNIEQAELLTLLEQWITQVLIPSIQSIEKNVLLTINQEFNRFFKQWFSTLIESEELEGNIDADFTPIVEQGGYELDVESLSGGEKTSVALAYRLALNTLVKQVTETMSSNLLILDEPTDGFSKAQLFKMRDILNDLGCNQVILVSHEAELEIVADAIYRVVKEGNVSRVTHP